MADLLDIAPSLAVEVVRIDGKPITVRGLSGNAFASLVARFPDLVIVVGGGDESGLRLLGRIGPAIGPVIAAACGHLGDEKYEQLADQLLVEDQAKLVAANSQADIPKRDSLLRAGDGGARSGRGRRSSKAGAAPLAEIALAITVLIRHGFPPDFAMNLTPRQIHAYCQFCNEITQIERAAAVEDVAIGAQGDGKTIQQHVKALRNGRVQGQD